VSFQVAILKILASYSDGRASSSQLKADLAIFYSSGTDWTKQITRLASFAPDLDIFTHRLVLYGSTLWQITGAGYDTLIAIEFAAQAEAAQIQAAGTKGAPFPDAQV
jgi:hypothetical protein